MKFGRAFGPPPSSTPLNPAAGKRTHSQREETQSDSGSPPSKTKNTEENMSKSALISLFDKLDFSKPTEIKKAFVAMAEEQDENNRRQESLILNLTEQITGLRKDFSASREEQSQVIVTSLLKAEAEKAKLEEKKPNLVILGLKENSGTPDKDVVTELFHKCKANPEAITSVFRMGVPGHERRGPRYLKVLTNLVAEKKKVMQEYWKVLDDIQAFQFSKSDTYNTYLRDDWTDRQQEIYREKVQQRNENNEGIPKHAPRWTIRDFELIPPKGRRN